MEAPAAHRRAGDGSSSSSIATHLANQNKVLKWLQDFSDKVEERARGAAAEVNGLLEEAGALELDMKTAVISFDDLTRQRFIEHKISDDDSAHSKMRDSVQSSLQSQVPAQDYERDILPRYKEALHIGLASCKEHFRNKGHSTTSVFRAMSAYGPLPHIIGSEEYNHDNSCGLADDVQPLAGEFSWLREFQGVSSDSGAADLFESQMLGVPQGFEKELGLFVLIGRISAQPATESFSMPYGGKTDTLVSAAREFKAMLEAALVNPYKFYDDASIAAQDVSVENTRTSELLHNTDPTVLTGMGEAARERSTEADTSKETLFASLQNAENDAHGIYSALVGEGLFDTGDEILSVDPVESADTRSSVQASGSSNPAIADSSERTFSINETTASGEEILIEGNATPSSSNHEEVEHSDACAAASPPTLKDDVSGSS